MGPIRIAERVWRRWQEGELVGRPGVDLLFTPTGDEGEALHLVTRAAQETIKELETRPPRATGEPFCTGAWFATVVPGGIALRIDEEPEDFEALLRGIAHRLEAAGADGAFDLLEHDPRPPLPELADLLECRLRVQGTRHHFRGPNWGWRAAPDALAAGVDAAIEWCSAETVSVPVALTVGLICPVAIPPGDDVRLNVQHGLRATAEYGVMRLTSATATHFRVAAIEPSAGRISLIEGGETIASAAWRPALERLEQACLSAASWAVYGYIKRGSRRLDAELGSLYMDWVPIPHHTANAGIGNAFEDSFAPDAFGAQLLGRGYLGRVPTGPDWNHAYVGETAVLVEHRDTSGWFGERLVPFGGQPLRSLIDGAVPIPDLVARAREDFKAVLFTDYIALS